jgi:hypothetical protein
MNSKRTVPLISKKVMSIVFICDFDMRDLFEPLIPFINTGLCHSFSSISLGEQYTSVTFILSKFVPKLNVALKTGHPFLQGDIETHTSYQHHNFHTTGVNALKS